MVKIRTDLAVEAREGADAGRLKGVEFDEKFNGRLAVGISCLKVLNKQGEESLGRKQGIYYTFEIKDLWENDGGYHREISEFIAGYIKDMIVGKLEGSEQPYHVLVVGLGNREATADALGPLIVSNLSIKDGGFAAVKALTPGVMAQTGMETADIIKGIVKYSKVDLIIAVDALAAKSPQRLANTIQITDTGILPGSGVGNHRHGIDMETMGVPVIAIGVPTVVEATAIVENSLLSLMDSMSDYKAFKNVRETYEGFSSWEKKHFLMELMPDNIAGMYVTPKDVDETVKRISFTISEALNICLGDME